MSSLSPRLRNPSLLALAAGLGVALTIFLLASAAIQAAVSAAGHRVQFEDAAGVPADQAALFIALSVVVLRQLTIIAALALIWAGSPEDALRTLRLGDWERRDLVRGLAWAAGTYAALIAYLALLDVLGLEGMLPQSTIGDEVTRTWPVLLVAGLSATVVAPLTEEFIFRGFLFNGLLRFGFLPAGLVSGFVFAVPHFDAASLVPFTAIGFVLAWLAWSSHGLRQPVVFHAAFNTASFIALLLW